MSPQSTVFFRKSTLLLWRFKWADWSSCALTTSSPPSVSATSWQPWQAAPLRCRLYTSLKSSASGSSSKTPTTTRSVWSYHLLYKRKTLNFVSIFRKLGNQHQTTHMICTGCTINSWIWYQSLEFQISCLWLTTIISSKCRLSILDRVGSCCCQFVNVCFFLSWQI